ncbi:hypothetical protein KA977_15265 [Candidatus Dependentiae bacterium]|nr:hypothetical protein [Candidatus Dependentiae bacterium]
MTVSELKPGMKGYGLSVFKNTEPETFGVEIISILKNTSPSRDLILIKCSGQNLEKSRIIAGMSGSPVYINNKLIGALAYAWSLSLDPIAGVTPIESMLYDYNHPINFSTQSNFISNSSIKSNGIEFTLIKSPLILSGINSKVMQKCPELFEKYNFLPLESGGAGQWSDDVKFTPGGAISVQLITGDWSIASIGTITAITDSGQILAFGHPMFGWGQSDLPVATAGIHTIMSNLNISWKMGSPIKENGTLVQDRYSCIVADQNKKTNMIKTKIKFGYKDLNLFKTYNLNIVDNKFLTPYLFLISAYNSEYAFAESTGPKLTIKQKLKIKFKPDYTLEFNNWEFNESGGLNDLMIFFNAFRLYSNPYKDIKIQELYYESEAFNGEFKYNISDISASADYCNIGDTIIFNIKLSHTANKDTFISIPVYISEDFEDIQNAVFYFTAGDRVPKITPEPENFDDYIKNMKQIFSNNQIVVYYKTKNDKYIYKNKILISGHETVNEKLFTEKSNLRKIPDYKYKALDCNFIVTGFASASVKIEQNNLLKIK